MCRMFLTSGLVVVWLSLAVQPAAAVIVYLKDQDQPIRGYFVRENEHVVVLQELLPNGSTAERSVPRSQIDDLIRSVSEERLEGLHPENPDAYREYAEELSEKRKDPDAQLTSIRLYQMAAVLEPQRLGRSCLLGMVPLARDASELRRFRAMAYLIGPDHDPALLQSTESAVPRATDLDEKQAEFLLKSLRALRQGRRKDALAQARRSKLRERLPLLTDTITYEEFEKACEATCPHCTRGRQPCPACGGTRSVAGGGLARVACSTCRAAGDVTCPNCRGNYKTHPLSPSLLKRILAVELQWMPGAEGPASPPSPARTSWSHTAQLGQTAPARELSLDTLTEFNPRENRYQEGRWTQ
ncbi:MAG: DnaJ-like cysteine-rich domain-containing protein [Pirellulaceae bacterium]